MIIYQQFAEQLHHQSRRAKHVLLTITEGPDGDSIGSMLAAAQVFEQLGVQPTCFSPDPIPPMFDYLRGRHQVLRELAETVHYFPLIILFDAGDVRRTPLIHDLIKRDKQKTTVVNIDHHPTVTTFQDQSAVDLNLVDTRAAATTEMLYHLFRAMGLTLDRYAATCLLTGILTDTGHFSNLGTTAGAMDVAAQLMAKGGEHDVITRATMRNKSQGTLQLWGRALSRLHVNQRQHMVTTVITLADLAECGVDHEATTGIANFLNTLSEGQVALVLQEAPDGMIKGSLRTTGPTNVADLAQEFGGGGHPKAAGFRIKGRLVKTKDGWRVEPTS